MVVSKVKIIFGVIKPQQILLAFSHAQVVTAVIINSITNISVKSGTCSSTLIQSTTSRSSFNTCIRGRKGNLCGSCNTGYRQNVVVFKKTEGVIRPFVVSFIVFVTLFCGCIYQQLRFISEDYFHLKKSPRNTSTGLCRV